MAAALNRKEKGERMTSEAQKAADARYKKKYVRRVVIPINQRTERELFLWMEERENMAGYIKGLVRKDIEEYKRAKAREIERKYS